ncbi:MAG: DUF2510 domain-containing protein [Kineosporiaceae bacterium]
MLDSPAAGQGWYPDPSGAHRYRYWDGRTWTPAVADQLPDAPPTTGRLPWRLLALAGLVGVLLVAGMAALTVALMRADAGPRDLAAISVRSDGVDLTWAPPPGPPAEVFVISRDGRDVATVQDATRYEDSDLSPRVAYHYTVRGVQDGVPTAASAEIVVRTPPWGATELHDAGTTSRSARLGWEPPPDGPPDQYVVQRDGIDLATLDGSTTSYTDTTATSGRYLHYDVVAVRDGMRSDPSAPLELHIVDRLVADARLDGAWDVSVKVTENHGTPLQTGESSTATWTFTPTCDAGACDLTVEGTLVDLPFRTKLTRQGAHYTGTMTTRAGTCADKPVTDTVAFAVTVTQGELTPGYWAAAHWSARVSVLMPYVVVGHRYCPRQSVAFTVVPQSADGGPPNQTVSLTGELRAAAGRPEPVSTR